MSTALLDSQGIDGGRVVSSLLSGLDVERIYLFGSRARGEQAPDSDVDLYVTVAPTDERWTRLTGKARALLSWMPVPKDVIVRTACNFDRRAGEFASLEYVVSREGVVLYG